MGVSNPETHKRFFSLVTMTMLVMGLLSPPMAVTVKSQTITPPAPLAGGVEKDFMGVEMVYVPGGDYNMGADISTLESLCSISSDAKSCVSSFSSTGILDKYQVKLPGFWIDRYEVTVDTYQSCVNVGGCTKIDLSKEPEFSKPRKPQINITWYDAARACSQRGGRLPSEEEWEYAASGSKKTIFPWGNSISLVTYPGGNTTYEVGTLSKNVSWIGVYDMAGNAAEWVEDHYLPYNRFTKNWSQFSDSERVLRGSSWGNGALYTATFLREHAVPEEIGRTNGFRCARYTHPSNRQ